MNLRGKNVLVTGGALRIGREIGRGFAARGANVLVHYHSSKKEAEALVRELRTRGVTGAAYRADLSSVSEIRKISRQILKDFGAVDILVNNASLFRPTPFKKAKEKDWDKSLSIHLKAPFFLAQALAPAMKKKGAGRIINIADWSGLRPYTGYIPYCVSKGALITLTEALAKTLAPEILVTAVCPGPILPPSEFGRRKRADVARKTLVGQWGRPEDIAQMVIFLAEQNFVTGSFHLVDGGELLG